MSVTVPLLVHSTVAVAAPVPVHVPNARLHVAARVRGLYVHVPYCVRKCAYCDFYSLPQGGRGLPPGRRFVDALATELALVVPRGFRPESIFVGGGTPTELEDEDLARLVAVLRGHLDLADLAEWTVESNPGTLTEPKARILKHGGVTRMSLGVQSFDAANLAFLGRIHTGDEAVEGFRLLRRVGFTNVNLDFIFGIPGGTRETLRRDLERAARELRPEHISCYCLIFEEGTPLRQRLDRGLVREVDEEEELAQYELVRETLGAAGYGQYEISNFARGAEHRCRHNLLYWGPGEYYGLGPSAHAHLGGVRSGNVRDLAAYVAALGKEPPERPVELEEGLSPERKAGEALVMWLRRTDGVPRVEFEAETGFDYADLRGAEIAGLTEKGLVAFDGETLKLTERGLFVSDSVFAELV